MKERELRLVRLASRFAPGMDSLLHYRGSWFRADALAGLSIWAVLVPQSLAYGELAGLRPTAGLYTALGAGALYALFGSSKYLNVGPESSVAIVVAASIGPLAGDDPERRLELAALLALLTALLLLVGALLRLGVITRLLSTPILAGYLAGSAVIIFCSQLPKVLDAEVDADRWWDNVWGTIRQLGDANLVSAGIAGLTVAILLLLGRWAKRASTTR